MMVGDSYEDDKVVYLEDDSVLAASLRVYTDEEKKHFLQTSSITKKKHVRESITSFTNVQTSSCRPVQLPDEHRPASILLTPKTPTSDAALLSFTPQPKTAPTSSLSSQSVNRKISRHDPISGMDRPSHWGTTPNRVRAVQKKSVTPSSISKPVVASQSASKPVPPHTSVSFRPAWLTPRNSTPSAASIDDTDEPESYSTVFNQLPARQPMTPAVCKQNLDSPSRKRLNSTPLVSSIYKAIKSCHSNEMRFLNADAYAVKPATSHVCVITAVVAEAPYSANAFIQVIVAVQDASDNIAASVANKRVIFLFKPETLRLQSIELVVGVKVRVYDVQILEKDEDECIVICTQHAQLA